MKLLPFCIACTLFSRLSVQGQESGSASASVQGHVYMLGGRVFKEAPVEKEGRMSILEDPERIRIVNLGPVLNTSGVEYAPQISPDGRTLYFVSDRKGSKLNRDKVPSHDLWTIRLFDSQDSMGSRPLPFDSQDRYGENGINTFYNEGAASFTSDGNTMFLTVCNRPGVYGKCDIFVSYRKSDGSWEAPLNVGKAINTDAWESSPAIAPDGRRLYFISNWSDYPNIDPNRQPNDMNIWYSDLDSATNTWQKARKLKELSTSGQELGPFILADNKTMIFSSNGHKDSYGGFDLYVSYFDVISGKWGEPENLGKPLNTPDDETYLTATSDQRFVFFSSKRKDIPGFAGEYDLYMASMSIRSTENKPEQVQDSVEIPIAEFGEHKDLGFYANVRLPVEMQVSLLVCDILGRKLVEIPGSRMTKGSHPVRIPLENLAPGAYFINVEAGGILIDTQGIVLSR